MMATIAGTYDDGNSKGHRVIRVKAIRVAQLYYLLAGSRQPEGHDIAQCPACQAEREESMEYLGDIS